MMIFLGGTCNESPWRDMLIPLLKIDFFNPVVEDWDAEAQERELESRKTADFVLYVITPRMTGVYSIAEVVDDSNKRPDKTLFCVMNEHDMVFNEHQTKSLEAVIAMVKANRVKVFTDLQEIADYVNQFAEPGDLS